MIIPLYIVDPSSGRRSKWPLLLLLCVNVLVFAYLGKVAEQNAQAVLGLYNFIGAESFTFRHLVLSGFLHADLWHLLFNMWFLWMFAKPLVSSLSPLFFFALYFGAGTTGTVLQDLLSEGGSIGASGAVSGVMGFFLIHFLRSKIYCLFVLYPVLPILLPAWLLVGFFIGWDIWGLVHDKPYVAYWAHLGGCLVGLLAGWAVYRHDQRVYDPG